jgi:uncharacterized protein
MNPADIINRFYAPDSPLAQTLMRHSQLVRDKALEVAQRVTHLHPDLPFIAEAAMLHDLGIYQTASARIGCRGSQPYICHGVIGRRLLEQCGLDAHALVCERHVGVGITRNDIEELGLPLPHRDMLPISIEEIIICYADKFYSKTNGGREHPLEKVLAELNRFGPDKTDRFLKWHQLFTGNGPETWAAHQQPEQI